MLQVEALSFAHPGAPPLLRDVSLTLAPGRTLCLLGPNGSGKTTLLRCVLGLLAAPSGRVLLDGHDVAALAPAARARRMAYVPQTGAASFAYSAFDVVLMGRSAHLRWMRDPALADTGAADAALRRLAIAHLAGRIFHSLSGGERQLVLIARALAQQAALLVLDEPCAGLDIGHQGQLMRALRALQDDGHALLLTTHLPEHAWALGADVALLSGGRLRGPAPAADLLTAAALSQLYACDVDVLRVPAGPARGQHVCVPVFDARSGR